MTKRFHIDDQDLRRYGFISLSAEGCGLGMRRLYDLTEVAVQILESFLSIEIKRGNNWNSSDDQVASIMLPWSIINELLAFCLLSVEQFDVAVAVDFSSESHRAHFLEGMSRDEWKDELEHFRTIFPKGFRVYQASGTAEGGTRNRHMMSGRVR